MTSMCAPGWTTEAGKSPEQQQASVMESSLQQPPHQQQHEGPSMAMAAHGQVPTEPLQVEAPAQPPQPRQQLQPPGLAAVLEHVLKRTASGASSSSGASGSSCQSQWGNTGATDVTWGGAQHHAAAAGSARALAGSAARPGAPLSRTGSGCKRPLSSCSSSSSSLSSSLADADAQNLAPQEFLHRILRERGYETEPVPADKQVFFQPPTAKQIEDYDLSLINAVKAGA